MTVRPTHLILLILTASCATPAEPEGATEHMARSGGQPPAGDVCAECAGQLMAAFAEVIGSSRPTLRDMQRFVHIEDDLLIASQELSEDRYDDYVNSDWDTTASLYGWRVRASVDTEADLTQYDARRDGGLCEVDMPEAGVSLTITNRPRCYVTDIRRQGRSLLE